MSMREIFRYDVTDTWTGAQRFGIMTNEVAEMCEVTPKLIRAWAGNKMAYGLDEELEETGCMYLRRYLIRRYLYEDKDDQSEKWISSTWSKERFSEEWEGACAPFLQLQNRRDNRLRRIRKRQAVSHG